MKMITFMFFMGFMVGLLSFMVGFLSVMVRISAWVGH